MISQETLADLVSIGFADDEDEAAAMLEDMGIEDEDEVLGW